MRKSSPDEGTSVRRWNGPPLGRGAPAPQARAVVARTTARTALLIERSHVLDDVRPELGALDLRRAFHETREVVGDLLRGDRAVHALDDEVRGFDPTHVAQHH